MNGGKKVTIEELQRETYKMAYLFALLHYHYANTLVKELGEDKGIALVEKAVKSFAVDRGTRMREKAVKIGLKPTIENLKMVDDLPAHTFYRDKDGNTVCPFADAWHEKGEIGQKLGLIYCNINDPWKIKSFDHTTRLWKYIKNRNLGDSFCDFENVEYLE